MKNKIPLAKIGRARGLKGQVRIDIYNPDSDLFVAGRVFYLERANSQRGESGWASHNLKGEKRFSPVFEATASNEQPETLTLAACDGQWCTFKEIQNVDDARRITGFELSLPREDLPKQKAGSYYHVDLIGCLVVDEETKKVVGALQEILYTASNDVWVVVSEKGEENLIPILDKVIAKIDLEQNKIFLNIPSVVS